MKKSIGILLTTVLLLAMAAPLMTVNAFAATDPDSWYTTVNGVLSTDYYSLYPYETNSSLKIGFSQFGEMINPKNNVGLEFGQVDPYAAPAGSGIPNGIPQKDWLQGWLINITYTNYMQGGVQRNVWATAQFSDTVETGNNWIRVDYTGDRDTTNGKANNNYYESPQDTGNLIYGSAPYLTNNAVNGGRKTNGTAVTDPIKVLYNGPREYVAEARTTIYDHPLIKNNATTNDVPLVQIVFTFVFDKVKSEVTILKDVKSLLPEKEANSMFIQFSNRGEVDLGTEATGYGSYAHFYTQGYNTTGTPGNTGASNETAQGLATVYNSDYQITQTAPTSVNSYFGGMPQATDATFDLATAIHNASSASYTWYAAFWPSLSDWTIDGFSSNIWWRSMTASMAHNRDVKSGDINRVEPFIPYYVGEWDFTLYHADAMISGLDNRTQFRGVTQYGLTYLHDAKDAQDNQVNKGVMNPGHVDSQVQYFLNQTFNPWDLQQAVDKPTKRYVEYKYLGNGDSFETKYTSVVDIPDIDWNDYGVFSERVEQLPAGTLMKRGIDYSLSFDELGRATFYGLDGGYTYKFLYSTFSQMNQYHKDIDPFTFTASEDFGTEGGVSGGTAYLHGSDGDTWIDPVGAIWTAELDDLDLDFTLNANGTSNQYNETTFNFQRSVRGWAEDFEVFKSSENAAGFEGSWDFEDLENEFDSPNAQNNLTLEIDFFDIHWHVIAPEFQDLKVDYLQFVATLDVEAVYNHTTKLLEIDADVTFTTETFYTEDQMGRYEWVTVGRDASTVDSAGAALVAEAFDSYKEIQIGIAGEDMFGATYDVQIPSVMAKFGSGTSVADYKDAPKAFNEVGYRAALINDWCTYWPVTSSNMIGVGGPLANVLSYYSNDFTTAFYGTSQFTSMYNSPYNGKITGITCWNRAWSINNNQYNLYSSADDSNYGYAVVSTFIDLNGTEVLEIYGHFARDTYYATQWFHGDLNRYGATRYIINLQDLLRDPDAMTSPGIQELQRMPAGVNSLILKIDYTDPKHPTFSIPELLGSISETEWTDYYATDVTDPVKGGIHDP